jgi:hypothetical protein
LTEFESAYQGLLSGFSQLSRRIVIVSPIPFSGVGPAGELAAERNRNLVRYEEVMKQLAAENEVVFVSLGEFRDSHFKSNGIYLSDLGQLHLATRLAEGLGVSSQWSQEVVDAVREKNRLWDQYYRPTNWAFLYGDRQHVPSSRDHKDTSRRWFEEELKRIPALINAKEAQIWQLAEGGKR